MTPTSRGWDGEPFLCPKRTAHAASCKHSVMDSAEAEGTPPGSSQFVPCYFCHRPGLLGPVVCKFLRGLECNFYTPIGEANA